MNPRRAIALSAVLVASALLPAVPADAVAPTCDGKKATIVDQDGRVRGTKGDDVIVAGTGDVFALSGDDTVCVKARWGVVKGGLGSDSIRLQGTKKTDTVRLVDFEEIRVALAAGDDLLTVDAAGSRGGEGRFEGGLGNDLLEMFAKGSVTIDLEDRRASFDAGKGSYQAPGFENALGSARRVTISGDAGPNALYGNGCRVTVSGGKGRDALVGLHDPEHAAALPCRPADRRYRMYGQQGPDQLAGGDGDDVLIGGPGSDIANGGDGVDRCEAERKRYCEG